MDFALKQTSLAYKFGSLVYVSILVLMDFALKPNSVVVGLSIPAGFNPCFDGFCSKTKSHHTFAVPLEPVSILVLMDFALKLTERLLDVLSDFLFQSLF